MPIRNHSRRNRRSCAGIEPDEGVVSLSGANGLGAFVVAAKAGRVWARERVIEERAEGTARRARAR